MSIASEITRINTNIAAAYTALDGKGATLPETQNSANLADTIDTITTGGGGSSLYDTLKAECDSITSSTTAAQLSMAGWQYIDTSYVGQALSYSMGGIAAYQFSNEVPDIYLKVGSTNYSGVKIPSDATISDSATTNVKKVSFVGCENAWILLIGYNPHSNSSFNLCVWDSSKTGNITYREAASKYIKTVYVKIQENTYTESSPTTLTSVDPYVYGIYSPYLEKISYSNNIQYDLASSSGISVTGYSAGTSWGECFFRPRSKKISITEMFNLFYPNFEEGVTSASADFSKNIITSVDYNASLMSLSDIPFVLDCSTITASSSYWYLSSNNYSQETSSPNNNIPLKLYLKLPDRNIDTRLRYFGSYRPNGLHPKYYKFMADNAPTVSGRTIKIHSTDQLNINDYDATILTTFTNKGWTVATS